MHRRDTLTALLFQFERMGLIIVILPYIITARRDRLIFDESPALSARRTDTCYAIVGVMVFNTYKSGIMPA